MEYKKLIVSFDYEDSKRFFRTLLVKPNIRLDDLGCVILTSLRSEFNHTFYFSDKKKNYMPKVFMEDFVRKNDVLMEEHTLEDLQNKFDFLYDTGEGYLFHCEKEKDIVEYEPDSEAGENELAILIDGKGIGIFEDDILALYAYLDGKLKPDNLKENKKIGAYIPRNVELGQWSDFDKYDLDEAKREFNAKVDFDRENYKSQANEECGDEDDCEYPYEKEVGDESDELNLTKSNVEFYNSINQMLDVLIKENSDIKKAFKDLKTKVKTDNAKDIMAKALVMELYECGKRGVSFDSKEYFMMMDKLTEEENQ